jgi:hypothetical protein
MALREKNKHLTAEAQRSAEEFKRMARILVFSEYLCASAVRIIIDFRNSTSG